MTDIRSPQAANYDLLTQRIAALLAAHHPDNVAASDADVQASEADVTAAENEPGLGDGSADPVRQAEGSAGLYAAPVPASNASAAANTAQAALNAAMLATRASLAHSAALLDNATAAVDAAMRQGAASFIPSGSTGWPG